MATRIVFLGSDKTEVLSLNVDQTPGNIGSTSTERLVQLTCEDKPVWVNLSNVLYLEEAVGTPINSS